MSAKRTTKSGFGTRCVIFSVTLLSVGALVAVFIGPMKRFIRESLMERVTSAHYQILCSPGSLSADAMRTFAKHRESLFAALNRKLDDADSNKEIRVIFDKEPLAGERNADPTQAYTVTGTTIRTKITGPTPQLDPAADAEALLYAAWGKPGNSRMGRWTAIWLVGDWRGEELGMAAADVEQRIGHKRVSSVLGQPSSEISPEDRAILGAAWLSELAELDGPGEVRKLYSSKMPALETTDVAKTLGTTPLELDRKWQMWMYAYLAGMPSAPQSMNMPMPSN